VVLSVVTNNDLCDRNFDIFLTYTPVWDFDLNLYLKFNIVVTNFLFTSILKFIRFSKRDTL